MCTYMVPTIAKIIWRKEFPGNDELIDEQDMEVTSLRNKMHPNEALRRVFAAMRL